MKEIAEVVRRERRLRDMTQEELANAIGMTKKSVFLLEQGKGGRKAYLKVLDYFGLELVVTVKSKTNEGDIIKENRA